MVSNKDRSICEDALRQPRCLNSSVSESSWLIGSTFGGEKFAEHGSKPGWWSRTVRPLTAIACLGLAVRVYMRRVS